MIGGVRMAKILLVYASITGNTEFLAEVIGNELLHQEHDVVVKTFDFDPIYVDEIDDYDAIVVGTHTWDDGDLPYEVEDFYEDLEEVDITNKPFAIFGSADSFYATYGGAIDLIADRAHNLGARVLPNRLKVDLEPDNEDIERCKNFAQMIDGVLRSG